MLPITFPNNFTFFSYMFNLGKEEFIFRYIKTGIKPKMDPVIIAINTSFSDVLSKIISLIPR